MKRIKSNRKDLLIKQYLNNINYTFVKYDILSAKEIIAIRLIRCINS